MPDHVATGFDFQPLPGGDVRIEFFGDDGRTFNTQVINGEAFGHLPILAYLTQVAIGQGTDAVKKMMNELMRNRQGLE